MGDALTGPVVIVISLGQCRTALPVMVGERFALDLSGNIGIVMVMEGIALDLVGNVVRIVVFAATTLIVVEGR